MFSRLTRLRLLGTGRFTAARLLYYKGVQIADREKPGSIKAIEPLRGIARTHRLAFVHGESQDTVMAASTELPSSLAQAQLLSMAAAPSGDGERALRNALQRLEPEGAARAAERGRVMMDLGDWYRIAGNGQRALSSWRDAWQQLTIAGDTSELAKPAAVIYRAPQMAVSQRREDPDEFSVQEVQLRVYIAADGDVREATVANPAPEREAAERAVLSAVRRAIWRPAFAGGLPVAATDFTFREQVYVRRPGEEPAASR